MNKSKIVIRFFLEIFLTISIVAFVLIKSICSTVLNKNYIIQLLNKTDYYNQVYDLLKSNFNQYIDQSGLDENVLKSIITKEKIEKDTNIIITNVFDGMNEEIYTGELKKNLLKNIDKTLNSSRLNKYDKSAINEFANQICTEYKNTICNFNYEDQINKIYNQTKNYIDLAKKISIIVMGISITFLILNHFKKLYKSILDIGIVLFSSGGVLEILNIYINTKIKVDYIMILNDPISTAIREAFHSIIRDTLSIGIILIILGLIFIVTSNIINSVIKHKKIKNEEIENS